MERNPLLCVVRRLRYGYLIRIVAGDMSLAVGRERLTRLAHYAGRNGLPEEANEILGDVLTMEEVEE